MAATTTNSLIEVTPRGPSIAGTRITVYSIMDFIKANWSKEEILQVMRITPEQLEAVYEYVEQHREAVEQEYVRILHREAEARAESERIMRARSSYPSDLSWEEKRKLLIQKLEAKNQADPARNGNHDTP